jgi:CheY-like chemotaxis protein
MQYRNVNILLVDDDQIDVAVVKDALEEHRIGNPVYVATDGVRALEMLRGLDHTHKVITPYLILLDLNMPRMNGIEFLRELRSDEKLRQSIVFVLTTSDDQRDVQAAYQYNVAGYVVKSRVGENFMNLISLLEEYKVLVQFPAVSDC